MPKQVPLYDALAADYDRFVNWEGRLAHELPFLLSLFEDRRVRRVLDSACGTGHHAIAIARQGYQVVGADLSAAMVERARENAEIASADVAFHVAGLGEMATHVCAQGCHPDQSRRAASHPGTLDKALDALLCLGNSLPHLLSSQAVAEALADFAAVLNPGGVVVIQNRNFDRVWAEKERFMPLQAHRASDGEWLFLRFYDFHDASITFNMVRLHRTEQGWQQDIEATELRPILGNEMVTALESAGFGQVLLYGGYDGSPFDPAQSGDLIAVATRQA